MSNLRQNLRLSYVPRWVIMPMLRAQTVSDHCWRVAVIVRALVAELDLGPDTEIEATLWAIRHDDDEALTGDTPSTQKPDPIFTDMDPMRLLVKVADYIESLTWAQLWAHESVQTDAVDHVWRRLKMATDALDRAYPDSDVRTAVVNIRREISNEP